MTIRILSLEERSFPFNDQDNDFIIRNFLSKIKRILSSGSKLFYRNSFRIFTNVSL